MIEVTRLARTHLAIALLGTITLITSVVGVRCAFPSRLTFFIVAKADRLLSRTREVHVGQEWLCLTGKWSVGVRSDHFSLRPAFV